MSAVSRAFQAGFLPTETLGSLLVCKEDIYVYSIDEVFIDVTSYLNIYKKNEVCLAKDIIEEVYKRTGICAKITASKIRYVFQAVMLNSLIL